MAKRIEEKYLIRYDEYSVIATRIGNMLVPDKNGENGKYSICSLYFDDPFDTALAEKEDGNAVHTKFRIRTYCGSKKLIKLERKIKRGTVTEKNSAVLTESELESVLNGTHIEETVECFGLVQELRSKAFRPAVSVRYDREAYVLPSLGVRVTFDLNIDSLPPEKETLFGGMNGYIPATDRNTVIMEIKYSERCPAFIRKCCLNSGMQISVSKYALCRFSKGVRQ